MKNHKSKPLSYAGLALAFLLFAFASANAINFTVGTDDFYVSVGDYDYLPYAYGAGYGGGYGGVPRVDFHAMMGDYGSWVSVPTFGQAWRPYTSRDWRPYTQGRWIYTAQYGPMWQGYEPWAWAGYHYGNWIFTQAYGWVWLPGYEWHPGRVAWAQGYDSIGWSPMPPSGYDYSRGQLGYVGPNSQYSYYDDDFGAGYDQFGYGGPYYDQRYQSSYYNPAYQQMGPQLWVFVESGNFWRENYADYYLGPDYTRDVFQRRLVRVTNQRLDRPMLERITRQRVVETPIEVRELQTEKQKVRLVVPKSEELRQQVQRNSTRVVRNVIAPAFAERNKVFKGENAKNKEGLRKAFHQENAKPKVETVDSKEVIARAERDNKVQDEERNRRVRVAKEKIERVEKEGKIRQPAPASQKQKVDPSRPSTPTPQPDNRDRNVNAPAPKNEQPDQRQNPNVRPAPQAQPKPQNPNVRTVPTVQPKPKDPYVRPDDRVQPPPDARERPVDPREQPDLEKDKPQPSDVEKVEPEKKDAEELKQQQKKDADAQKKKNKNNKKKDKDKDNNNEDDDPPSE